ncbi:glycerophosphodiester phosphodiesterase family protein [Sphingomonas sp. RHCKR7]|uniref:glycerophosphodiester phosphodiesterase family protein n=1 Tax=Sphingomonas folli TaxID=2862497 RepID=UPI001CA47382|nr:glycerophosphodiester phosphodiesterase family protein [Sphingomonas folli]MBW6527600.1 glycerophosphodiester phosphodiesterase family protein [Sphingomonas folli]
MPIAFLAAALTVAAPASPSTGPAGGSAAIRARLDDPRGGLIVAAHRGCHAPAPHHGLGASVPENSRAALERCVALGVDVMEVDVRRSADGVLVILHDATVDRTTDGQGAVDRLGWAELQRLHLRLGAEGEGGDGAAVSEERLLTLDQMLALARGRILLNLDVKANIYAEVAAAVRRARMEQAIILKSEVGADTPAMAAEPTFAGVGYMPILLNPGRRADLAALLRRQTAAPAHPLGVELPRLGAAQLVQVSAAARACGVRLWVNSLWEGFAAGYGGDREALRDPDAVWGRLYRDGVSIIQTDEPEALLRYRATLR